MRSIHASDCMSETDITGNKNCVDVQTKKDEVRIITIIRTIGNALNTQTLVF